jgi:hypothetical protein
MKYDGIQFNGFGYGLALANNVNEMELRMEEEKLRCFANNWNIQSIKQIGIKLGGIGTKSAIPKVYYLFLSAKTNGMISQVS